MSNLYIVCTPGTITLQGGGTIQSVEKLPAQTESEQVKTFLGIAAKLCKAVRKHNRHAHILTELCQAYQSLPTSARLADDPLVKGGL